MHLGVHPVIAEELDHSGVVLAAIHLGLVAAAEEEQREGLFVAGAAGRREGLGTEWKDKVGRRRRTCVSAFENGEPAAGRSNQFSHFL